MRKRAIRWGFGVGSPTAQKVKRVSLWLINETWIVTGTNSTCSDLKI